MVNNNMAEGKTVNTADAVVDTVPAAAESFPATAESVPAAAESFPDTSTSIPTAVESVATDSDPFNDPSGNSDSNKFNSLFSGTVYEISGQRLFCSSC
jgi:hypothetical protein